MEGDIVMKKKGKHLFIILLIISITTNVYIVYGESLRDEERKIEENAYDLGYDDGEDEGRKNRKDEIDKSYRRAMPSEKEIIRRFKKEYRSDYDSYYDDVIIENYKDGFEDGYKRGYKKTDSDSKDTSYEAGEKDGEYFGKILGINDGTNDQHNNYSSNYKRNMYSDSHIRREYSLDADENEYRDGFIDGFKKAYEENYKEAFRATNLNEHRWSYEESYNHGKEAGLKRGEANATNDYYLKLNNNWKRHEPTQLEIKREYNLTLESERYIEGFISGFKEGLSEGYTITFQKLNKEVSQAKITIEEVPIAGGEIFSLDKIMSLKIGKGIYYNPVIVTINVLSDSIGYLDQNFIKASDYYSVNILNKSNETNNKENIEIKFEYYGKQDGGIYKLVNGKWLYLPSTIVDGFIKTKVKPNSFKDKDNIYCVLIDKKALLLQDIRGHWAKDEITTFLRRAIVSGYSDKTFKPDKNITRGEFLTILSKVYDWKIPNDTKNIVEFKDYNIFKSYKEVISYAINMGYINGYSDKTFKPHKNITYKEVENIMKRVTNTKNFYWYNISSKMLYEKDYRSKSYNNMNNNITRAETVYMLYVLNEWKY